MIPPTVLNILLILILVAIAGAIIFYLVREKKKGAVCVGCPYAGKCAKGQTGKCDCGGTGH